MESWRDTGMWPVRFSAVAHRLHHRDAAQSAVQASPKPTPTPTPRTDRFSFFFVILFIIFFISFLLFTLSCSFPFAFHHFPFFSLFLLCLFSYLVFCSN
jgi:hypothetical protein